MQPHRMHLKGPWHYEWVARREGASPGLTGADKAGRVKMPNSWQTLFGDTRGIVRFTRRFHRPTNLDADERVSIVFDGLGGRTVVAVNDVELGASADSQTTAAFDITHLLQPSNMLRVDVECDRPADNKKPCGLWGPVAIEIHRDEV